MRRAAVALSAMATLVGVPATAAASFSASTVNLTNRFVMTATEYPTEVLSHGPYLYWRLDEIHGNTATDSSGNGVDGRYAPNLNQGFTPLPDGALETSTPDRAMRLDRPDSCIVSHGGSATAAPQVFTVIAWFRAPTGYDLGGKLVGFEQPRTDVAPPGLGGNYDRQLYLDGNGRVWFTVYHGGHVAVSSENGLADGGWHMAVGTQGADGMRLYVDGELIGSNANTAAESTTGWWRAGCGNLSGWGDAWTGPNDPGQFDLIPQNRPFMADLDEITVYADTALDASDVAALYFAR